MECAFETTGCYWVSCARKGMSNEYSLAGKTCHCVNSVDKSIVTDSSWIAGSEKGQAMLSDLCCSNWQWAVLHCPLFSLDFSTSDFHLLDLPDMPSVEKCWGMMLSCWSEEVAASTELTLVPEGARCSCFLLIQGSWIGWRWCRKRKCVIHTCSYCTSMFKQLCNILLAINQILLQRFLNNFHNYKLILTHWG
jgi:hypothetical protein